MLYEGYMLYPYRPSAVKNRQRFNFGLLAPRARAESQGGGEAWSMRTECLVSGDESAAIDVRARFLQPITREVGEPSKDGGEAGERFEIDGARFRKAASLEVGGRVYQKWQEVLEREARLDRLIMKDVLSGARRLEFGFPASSEGEILRDESGRVAGGLLRSSRSIEGAIEVRAVSAGEGLFRVTVEIANTTPPEESRETESERALEESRETEREDALARSFVSTHTILVARDGEFVSLLDPPDSLRDAVAACVNAGTWPVLVGDEGERDVMLSSPIILYDYPQIAPESAGDLFDGTEIDEILTLRILTLTEEEKREMRGADERARLLLERTEALPAEGLMKLHGTVRSLRPLEGDEK